ncbi:MAG: PAS domain-containing sensor histidine kinase [Bacteroidia bacterium]|nr:PAS domain-containing sensor histidine kinase [Bacteroidia bacterium]
MDKHQEHALLAPTSVERRSDFNSKKNVKAISEYSKTALYQEYRESRIKESRLGFILDQCEEMILALDSQNQIIFLNRGFKEHFQSRFSISLLEGSHFPDALKGKLKSYWEDLLKRAKNGINFEDQIKLEVKEVGFQYRSRFVAEKDNEGKLKESWFFLKDITAEAEELEQVYKKQSMFESISNSVQEGIFRSSRDEGIIYVNLAFARMFGYDTVEEILTINPSKLYMNPDRRNDFVRIVQEHGSFFNEEVEFRRKDGTSFWGLISSVPSYDQYGKRYHDGAIRDVTQLKEVERSLKENFEELQKVNRELDRFVYSTSHDLRAPLVSIAGLINITRIETDENLRQKYLGLMDNSIQKLDDFIKDIIGYSRNSRLELKFEEVNFQELLEDTFESLSPKGSSRPIRTALNIEGKADFVTDLTRLNTIFNNLLSNAFRYHDPEKEESFIEVNIKLERDEVLIQVKDNGIGIEEKYQDKIFQMFYRATQKSQGSGIGLYIVKEAVEKLGGEISVESEAGLGTTFNLRIPKGEKE